MQKKLLSFIFITIILLTSTAYASGPELQLTASAVVLMEQATGQVLYSRNAHGRMYPASTTKMLTALLAYRHLSLDTIVVAGTEMRSVPGGFSTAGHFEGETLTVYVLLNALLIPSGNDSAMVLAMEVIRTLENRRNIPVNEAQMRFANLMNEEARALGATGSNFHNPFGMHHEMHYTTAHDMALIGRAFMENPVLAQISAKRVFESDSLGGRTHPDARVRSFTWVNTNLMLPGAAFAHPFITGGRTGFTTPAGHCFVGAAYSNGLSLIAVVLYSREPDRWTDTRMLLDYGFFNYSFREIATEGQLLETVTIDNPRLGDIDTLEIYLSEGHTALLSHTQYAALERRIIFDPLLLADRYENGTVLHAPIEYRGIVGRVEYRIGSEIIFTAHALALRYVGKRTFDSDMDYYMAMIFDNIFTRRALPYWFGFWGTVFGIVGICMAVSAKRRLRRQEKWNSPEPPRRRIR